MLEHVFDTSGVHALPDAVKPATALIDRDDLLPVSPALRPLLPDGGLRRGSTLAVDGVGATSLTFALLAEISAQGGWCAAVGVRGLGLLAAQHAGLDLSRLVLVTAPGPDWPTIVATLLDAFEVVVLGRVNPVSIRLQRRLAVRVRDRGRVLVSLGSSAVGDVPVDVRLIGTGAGWRGLERGAGHLHSRQVRIRAEGRRLAGRPRRAAVLLPAADGRLTAAARADPGVIDRPVLVEASA